MKQSFVIITAVLLVAAAAILAGCTSQTTPDRVVTTQSQSAIPTQSNQPNTQPTQPIQPTQPSQPAQTVNSQNQDDLFQSTVLNSMNSLNLTMSKVADDGQNMDMVALQKDAFTVSSQAGTYYVQIKNMKVSPEFQDIQTNYLLILQDVQSGADLYMKGAVSVQAGDIDAGTKYISQGVTNFDSATQHMATMLGSV